MDSEEVLRLSRGNCARDCEVHRPGAKVHSMCRDAEMQRCRGADAQKWCRAGGGEVEQSMFRARAEVQMFRSDTEQLKQSIFCISAVARGSEENIWMC